MATINLLPWREQLRDERKQQFFVLSGLSVGLAVLLMVFIHSVIGIKIHYQNNRNQFLQEQIAVLDSKIKEIDDYKAQKDKILTRMRIIYELQSDRPIIVHMFADLVDRVPSGLYLTAIERKGTQMTLDGRAESNIIISQVMRNLEASQWFNNPVLNQIENDQKTSPRRSDFELVVNTVAGSKLLSDQAKDASKDGSATATKTPG